MQHAVDQSGKFKLTLSIANTEGSHKTLRMFVI